jgi:hypothetical protein
MQQRAGLMIGVAEYVRVGVVRRRVVYIQMSSATFDWNVFIFVNELQMACVSACRSARSNVSTSYSPPGMFYRGLHPHVRRFLLAWQSRGVRARASPPFVVYSGRDKYEVPRNELTMMRWTYYMEHIRRRMESVAASTHNILNLKRRLEKSDNDGAARRIQSIYEFTVHGVQPFARVNQSHLLDDNPHRRYGQHQRGQSRIERISHRRGK